MEAWAIRGSSPDSDQRDVERSVVGGLVVVGRLVGRLLDLCALPGVEGGLARLGTATRTSDVATVAAARGLRVIRHLGREGRRLSGLGAVAATSLVEAVGTARRAVLVLLVGTGAAVAVGVAACGAARGLGGGALRGGGGFLGGTLSGSVVVLLILGGLTRVVALVVLVTGVVVTGRRTGARASPPATPFFRYTVTGLVASSGAFSIFSIPLV
jgi:hypothetical protein